MKIQFFWDMTMHWLVSSYWHFGDTCCLCLEGLCRWRQRWQAPMKHQQPFNEWHGTIFQNNWILLSNSVKASNFITFIFLGDLYYLAAGNVRNGVLTFFMWAYKFSDSMA